MTMNVCSTLSSISVMRLSTELKHKRGLIGETAALSFLEGSAFCWRDVPNSAFLGDKIHWAFFLITTFSRVFWNIATTFPCLGAFPTTQTHPRTPEAPSTVPGPSLYVTLKPNISCDHKVGWTVDPWKVYDETVMLFHQMHDKEPFVCSNTLQHRAMPWLASQIPIADFRKQMKSRGICTSSRRFARHVLQSFTKRDSCHFKCHQSLGLNQDACNITHHIAGSPLWNPNSPRTLSSVAISGYRNYPPSN